MRAKSVFHLSLLAGLLTLSAPDARACIGDSLDSIHFNSGHPDYGTVPRRDRVRQNGDRYLYDSRGEGSMSGIELVENPKCGPEWERNRDHFLKIADDLFKQRKWQKSLAAFQYVVARFGVRGVVKDRIEILSVLVRPGQRIDSTLQKALLEYALAVSVAHDEPHPPEASVRAIERLTENSSIGFLRRHAMYQRACLAWEADHPEDATLWFQRFLKAFRTGLKREESLIMMARACILSEDGAHRNANICQSTLDQLQREFPKSRFRRSALGLRGRCFYVTGRYRDALECYFAVGDMPSAEITAKSMSSGLPSNYSARLLAGYLRRLASAKNAYQYEHAVESIDRISASFVANDARKFSYLLTHDLTLPAPYFYYRLYHKYEFWKGLGQMAQKADEILATHSAATLPALIQVRFAEIYYQQKRFQLALQWTNRAINSAASSKPAWGERPDETLTRALYVRGATLHKLKRYRPAISDFENLVGRYPDNPLVHGSREELALLYEAVGDLESALDQYFYLGYQADVAFFLDARMRPEQIERYLHRCKAGRYTKPEVYSRGRRADIPKSVVIRDLVIYSLGIRYLRGEKWDRAAYWFRQVPRATYTNFSLGRRDWEGSHSADPLTVIRELGRLHRSAQTARDSNSRALALFRYASYYYRHGTLLLYNPALWQESREFNFGMFWNDVHATKEDEKARYEHMHEHEVYARALVICRDIATRYPDSPVAPQALFRAATAADKLCSLNSWWRPGVNSHNYELDAARYMKTLAKRYPKSPLVKEADKFAVVFANEAE